MMNQFPLPFSVPPGLVGNARLYLPHRLFAGHPSSFQPGDSPVAISGQFALLPNFPLPPYIPLFVANAGLHLYPLEEAEHKTSSKAQTKTSTQIQLLQGSNDKLEHVRSCPSFWGNLVNYARHPNIQQGGLAPPANTTWTLPVAQRIPLPLAQQQVEGVRFLASWYIYHNNRGPVISKVNNEPGVQSEFSIQAMEPMNGLLKTRYPPLKAGLKHRAYPCWGRSCDALHRNPGVRMNSGYPDFLLIRSSDTHDNGAVGEIKTWWSYTQVHFDALFDHHTVFNGTLVQTSRTPMAKLLKQVWGQLHFFECNLGFCTNGKLIMFFARSGPNTIVLSHPRQWDHPEVHEALAGLSYAAVDSRHVGANAIVDQILCPLGDRRVGW